MSRVAFIALFAALAPAAKAQRSPAPPGFTGLAAASHSAFGQSTGSSGFLPVFFDSAYPGYFAAPSYPAVVQPPIILVESATPPAAVIERAPTPVQPLLIELQGNRYVQLSGENESSIQRIEEEKPSKALHGLALTSQSSPTNQRSNVLLVFRDGHREEVSSYTIVGGALYVGDDGHANDTWSRKIEMSSLDLPGTLNSNQSRGIHFHFPTAPNEIVVGP